MNDQPGGTRVIVIGSGFGGAVAACRLAQAGFEVTILERGRRYRQGDFPNLPQDSALLPEERRWSWSLDQGLWEVLDLEEIVSIQAAGLGGGSLVYANVHLRPPKSVFSAEWPVRHQGRAGLDPYFDLVASMLEVAPVSAHPQFHGEIVKSAQFGAAAAQLQRSVFYPPLAIRYEGEGTNAHGVPQGKCTGCGACCGGCPQSAKNTLDLNYLAIAERHGARVVTQCEVLGLVETADGDWMVRCFDHLEAQKRTFRAPHVFLCAGAVHSTRLMSQAQLLNGARAGARPRPVKALVGTGYFPGGDSLGVVYDTAHPQRPSVGPAISTATVQWSLKDPTSFFMLQDGGYPAPVDRLVGVLRASAWLERNKRSKSGTANVRRTRTRQRLLGRPAVPFPTTRAPSCADDLLRAYSAGAFGEVVPSQLRALKDQFSEQLSGPLVLSAVVAETIRGGILFRWGWLGGLARFVASVGMRLARVLLGNERSLGVRAVRVLLDGGRLKVEDLAAQVGGYDGAKSQHRAVLLGMGRDAALGVLQYDRRRKRMVADLNLVKLTPGYTEQECLMTDIARELGGELRTNPAWEYRRKPVTVHNQGGCGMSDDPAHGVTDAFGKVHGCEGLYILDGSILCRSVGVNPSATIAALSECGVLEFIRAHKPNWPDQSAGGQEYERQRRLAAAWAAVASAERWDLEPPGPVPRPLRATGAAAPTQTVPIGLELSERLRGYYQETKSRPSDPSAYLALETRGRPHWPVELNLNLRVENLAAFFEDPEHLVDVTGTVDIRLPGREESSRYVISQGRIKLFVRVHKDYAIGDEEKARLRAQQRASEGQYASVRAERGERRMIYSMSFNDEAGRAWTLHGFKRIASASSLDAWRQTSILCLALSGEDPQGGASVIRGGGAVHVDLNGFLYQQLPSVRATGTDDPVRAAWAVSEFTAFFFGTLQRIYLPALRAAARAPSARSRLEQSEP